MATRFLVPRANAEGGIGTSTKKWNEANFVTGNFTTLKIGATPVEITSTAAELNILDGVTASTAELNYLDITTLGTSQASKALTADSSGDVKLAGNLQLNAQKELRFADADSSHHVGFKSPATVSSNTVYTLPDAYPDASGKVLSSTTAGVLSWAANAGGGGNAFTTFAVSGQSDVVADSATDTLTLVAGSNVTITTNASSDTITIAASGGGGSGDIEGVTAGDGLSGGGTTGTVSLALDLNELTAAVVDVANDSIAIIDATDNSSKKESIADLVTAVKGNGLTATNGVLDVNINTANLQFTGTQIRLKGIASNSNTGLAGGDGSALNLDLDNIPAETVDVSADSFAFIDASNTNVTKKELISDLITAVAGDGLAASSGVLSVGVDDSSIETDSDALRVKASGITNAMLNGSIADSKLNQITTADKVAGSAVQLASTSALENSTGLRIKDATAGNGLAIASQVLSVDLNELSAAVVDVSADSIAIIDANDSNGSKKESIVDLVAGIAGTGLSASSGQLSVTGGTAAEATSVTVTANNSADETVYPTFVDGATGSQGIETDTGLTYNPSTGILTTETLSVKSDLRLEHSGTAKTITVTVAAKSASHRYNGTGSSNGYKLDGVESPFLILAPGRTYKFDQADGTNSGHPLRFYLDAGKTTAYTAGVTASGTPGSSGAYTQIVISDSTPQVLHYQCSAHGYMGNALQSNSIDAELNAIAGLTSAADKGIQFTGSGTAATYDLTDAGRALLDDANASAQRTTLGLAIGSDVQAYDADLAAIAGLTSAADKGIQFTGSGTAATYDLTAAGKALLDDANAAAQRTTLGLGNAATLAVGISNTNVLQANASVADNDFLRVDGTSIEGRTASEVLSDIGAQASDTGLTSIAGLTTAADKMIYTTDSDTYAVTSLTAAGRAILDDANAAAQRVTLGVGTTDNPTFAGGTLGSIQVGLTGDNEIDTASGNLTIDSAGGTVTIDDNLTVSGNASIVGNLTVTGTTTTLNSEIALADRFMLLNSNYTTDAAVDGGIVINVDPSSTVYDGSSININFATSTTVQIAGDASTELAANKIFMIRNAEDVANNGLYQVHSSSHSSGTTTVTIKDASSNQPSAAVSGIVNTSFTTNSDDDSAVIAKTKIAVLKSDTANNVFEVGFGDDGSSLSYTDLATSGGGITGLSTNASDTLTIGTSYNLIPNSAGTSDLGTASAEFGNIFIADDKKLQFGSDQDITIEYDEDGDDVLQIAGGNIRIGHGDASQLQFRDSAVYINSDADGYLNARADTGITLNVNGTDELALTGSTATFGTNIVVPDSATIGSVSDTNLLTLGTDILTVAGEVSMTTLDIGGTNVTSTATELNIMDGNTSASSVTIVDADRVVLNDDGTMKQVAVTDLAAYFDDEITSMPNLSSAVGLTTIGASGATTNIAAGDLTMYNAVNNGNPSVKIGSSSAEALSIQAIYDSSLQTLDKVEFSTAAASTTADKGKFVFDVDGTDILTIDDGGLELKDSSTIGIASDVDLLTLTSGKVTIAGELQATTLDIGGTNIAATAAELNIMDGDTSATSTTLADADRVVVNDAGTMKQVALTDFETYFETSLDTLSNVTTVGALNAGSITSGFGAIDNGTSNITTTGLISGGSLDIDDVLINGSTIGHTDDTDLITLANGVVTVAGEISVITLDIGGTNVTATAAELNLLDGGTSVGSSITIVDADGFIINDNGTMKTIPASALKTYASSGVSTSVGDGTEALAYDGSGNVDFDAVALDIDASGAITVDGTSTLSIDSADTTNLTMTANSSSAKTLTIAASNSGSEVSAIDIDADGAITVDAGAGLSLDSADDSNLTMTANSSSHKTLTIASANSGSGKGKIDIDASGDITIDTSAGGISLDSTDTTNLTMTTAASHAAKKHLTISATNAHSSYQSDIDITADGLVDIDAGVDVEIDAGNDVNITAADIISLTTSSADGHISLVSAHTAGVAFHIDANADSQSEVQIDAGILDIDVTGAATVDAGGALSLTGAGVNIAGGSSEVDITTSGALDLNVGSVDLDSSAGIAIDGTTLSLDGTDATNLTMTANSSSDRTLTIAASNSGSGSGIISLSADSLSLTGSAAFGSAATFNAGLLTKAGSSAGFVRFYEQSGNGSNYIGLVAPDAVSSDVSFTLPSADGSSGQVLQTNGSGVLSFVDQSGGGGTATDLTKTSGNITIDAQGNDTDIIFKGTDGSSDTTFLTLDGSEAGAATFNSSVTVGGDLNVNGDTTTFTSANTTDPLVIIKNTTNDASGARLRLVKDKGAAGADNDVAGLIEFYADDASQDQVKFAEVKAQVADATQGAEGGKLTLSVASHDGELVSGIVINGSSQFTDNTCDTTNTSTSVTMDSTADLKVGMSVSGTGIPNGASISSISNSTTFVLSAAATANGTNVTLTFGNIEDEVDVTVAGNFNVNGDTSTFASANSTDPLVIIKNTTNDANGARLRLVKDKGAAGANNDLAGTLEFYADDADQNQVLFGQIKVQVSDASSDYGKISILPRSYSGSPYNGGLVLTGGLEGSSSGKVDATLGEGSASTVTIPGKLVVNGSGTHTFNGSIEVDTYNSGQPLVNIKNRNPDANSSELRFTKDGASVADNDVVGVINFVSEDDADNAQTYGSIKSTIADASSGAEGGKLELFVAEHDGTITTSGLSLTDGDADGEIDATIGAGSSSVTTVAGKISLGGVTYTFPASDGSNGQFLKTDGSGTLSFGAASGSGGSRTEPLTISATTHTIGSTDNSDTAISSSDLERIYVFSASSATTVTLPASSGLNGLKLHIKRTGSANVTVDGNASETIDGATTFVLSTQYEAITIVSDNANWIII